jgi:hypothetical protein
MCYFHRVQLGRATESCISTPSYGLGLIRQTDEATQHLSNSVKELEMLTHPRKVSHVKILCSLVIEVILIHGLSTQ